MNSIYNNNIMHLQWRFDALYNAHRTIIEDYKNNNAKRVQEYEAREHIEVLKAKNNSIIARANDILLHSSYNPEAEAHKFIDHKDLHEKRLGVFLGFGLGYGPLAFTDLYRDKILFLIEPDIERVLWAFSYVDFTKVLARDEIVCLFSAPPHDCIRLIEHFNIDMAFFIKNESHALHNKDFFQTLAQLIDRNIQKSEINKNTLNRFGQLWLKNTMKNKEHYATYTTITCLKNIHGGEKALILAAGPSLRSALPLLPELSKKMIVICVDTALENCLQTGVEPDYLITVDPQYWNARHIRHLSAPNTTLITEISSYPSVFRFPCKDIFLIKSFYPLSSLIEKKLVERGLPEFERLAAGGSVSTTAWELALWLGCTDIFFAGLDLSFPNNLSHAKNSFFEKKARYEQSRLSPFATKSACALFSAPSLLKENYNGKLVLTDTRMELYSWWFESRIAEHHIKTYVLSKDGIKIPGIDYYDMMLLLNNKDIEKKEVQKTVQNIRQKKIAQEVLAEMRVQISQDLAMAKEAWEDLMTNTTPSTNPKSEQSYTIYGEYKKKLKDSLLYSLYSDGGLTIGETEKRTRNEQQTSNDHIDRTYYLRFYKKAYTALAFLDKYFK